MYVHIPTPIVVDPMLQVKITSNNDEMLRAAVEQFIDKTDKEIQVNYAEADYYEEF